MTAIKLNNSTTATVKAWKKRWSNKFWGQSSNKFVKSKSNRKLQIKNRKSKMAREPIPSWYFVLVVVRKDDKFLLVHERKHEQKWYLPAGRVEPRENFVQAARRETLEETGVPVIIEGILKVQHTPMFDGTARVRFIVIARPEDDTPPKSEPDEESLGAAWMSLEEMKQVSLRGEEVLEIFEYVTHEAPIYPLNLITSEAPLYFGSIPNLAD